MPSTTGKLSNPRLFGIDAETQGDISEFSRQIKRSLEERGLIQGDHFQTDYFSEHGVVIIIVDGQHVQTARSLLDENGLPPISIAFDGTEGPDEILQMLQRISEIRAQRHLGM